MFTSLAITVGIVVGYSLGYRKGTKDQFIRDITAMINTDMTPFGDKEFAATPFDDEPELVKDPREGILGYDCRRSNLN